MTFAGWMNSFSNTLTPFTVPSVEEADEQNNNRKNTSVQMMPIQKTAILTLTTRTAIEMIIMLIKKNKTNNSNQGPH